jgi:hypothetical protein
VFLILLSFSIFLKLLKMKRNKQIKEIPFGAALCPEAGRLLLFLLQKHEGQGRGEGRPGVALSQGTAWELLLLKVH